MTKEPHVLVYPVDQKGCGMYRMTWPGQAVRASGKSVNVMPKLPQRAVDWRSGKVVQVNIGTADVVVYQRPSSISLQETIPLIQDTGVKVVIDMDDSFSLIHPKNPAYKGLDPRLSHKKNWMHAAKACEMADLVTVTTQALAEEYGQHGRVLVIPNHIPKSYLKVQRPLNVVPVVGWAGWTSTHVNDLRVTKGKINEVLVDTGAKFTAYGDRNIFTEFGIPFKIPHDYWGFTNILDYPKTLVGFDIGLVPLQPSPFNEAKSWLKGLEYASLGIVPIVTPIGDYLNLIDIGAAIPAATPQDWYDRVRELILDHEMRAELSQKVREIAAEWTFEGNTHKWWSAWDMVYRESELVI